MIQPNPNTEVYNKVTLAVKNNDGYCPCLLEKNEDTKCVCTEFLTKVRNGEKGFCRCGRFVND